MKQRALTKTYKISRDPHHDGQQVLILTFEVDGEDKKMVYKPASIEIDAKVTGNSNQLGYVLNVVQPNSFFECINTKSPEHQLPTYLIVPRCDPDKNKIGGGYGYAEYLPHNPWYNIDFDKEARDFFGKFAPTDRARHFREFQEHLDNMVKSTIEGARSNSNCDYITDKQSDIERYSYLCGAYCAAMCALGISDMHVENAIISNKTPYLIDLESALNVPIPDVQGTIAFDPAHGAFLSDTKVPIRWSCFLDIDGDFSSHEEDKIEKNRFFVNKRGCLYIKKKEIEPCQHDYGCLEKGFEDTIRIICSNQDYFLEFTQTLADTPVRVVAIDTAELYGMQNGFVKHYINSTENEFKKAIDERKLTLFLAFETNLERDCKFMAYSNQYFVGQLMNMSLPINYAMSDRQTLYDCSGNEIPQHFERLILEEDEEPSLRDPTRLEAVLRERCEKNEVICYYLNNTPLEAVQSTIINMNIEEMMAQFRETEEIQKIRSNIGSSNVDKRGDCCCTIS